MEETKTRTIILLLAAAWLLPWLWASTLWISGRLVSHEVCPNLDRAGNIFVVVLTWATLLATWGASVLVGLMVAVVAALASDRGVLWRLAFSVAGLVSSAAAFPCLIILPLYVIG